MPHLIIEHSVNIDKNSIIVLQKEIQKIMHIAEGNFDADQCKCRSFSFAEYLVGIPDQSTSSFVHITLKVLSGRTIAVRQNLSLQILEFSKKFFSGLNLVTKRCDISVDIVEMERDTYQKWRKES